MKWKHIFILLMCLPALSGLGQEKYTLSGVIVDKSSGKALTGIDIVVKNTNTGTISNQKGTFLLYLDQGQYNVTISGKGYYLQNLTVDLNENKQEEVSLRREIPKVKKQWKKKEKKSNHQATLLSQK
ncbi:MAG: carboxypeptidase-like regulatory domain-containing protein [Prolixibacteraceae bacterium]